MTTMTMPPAYGSAAVTRPSTHGVRLTQRGRLVVFVFSFVLVALLFVAFAAGSVGSSDRHIGSGTAVVVVSPGQTLWDVASSASTGGDVRDMMKRIEDLNSLQSAVLQSGQRLRVPTSD